MGTTREQVIDDAVTEAAATFIANQLGKPVTRDDVKTTLSIAFGNQNFIDRMRIVRAKDEGLEEIKRLIKALMNGVIQNGGTQDELDHLVTAYNAINSCRDHQWTDTDTIATVFPTLAD